jgi:plasmid stability protein
MATLYVENIPEKLYAALRSRAQKNRKSIAREVVSLLEEHIVTAEELKARERFFRQAMRLRGSSRRSAAPSFTAESLQREDRQR